eukprot:271426_1
MAKYMIIAVSLLYITTAFTGHDYDTMPSCDYTERTGPIENPCRSECMSTRGLTHAVRIAYCANNGAICLHSGIRGCGADKNGDLKRGEFIICGGTHMSELPSKKMLALSYMQQVPLKPCNNKKVDGEPHGCYWELSP